MAATNTDATIPVVGMREPCPCGSGRRYKACHGRASAVTWNPHPFADLPGEADWIAMREIVPAATARIRLRDSAYCDATDATVATLLPMSWPALVRTDGSIYAGLQTTTSSGDPSRDVADALLRAVASPAGVPVAPNRVAAGPRLQDIVDLEFPFEVVVHEGFNFWLEGFEHGDDVQASLEQANESVVPTVRLRAVPGAYWCRIGTRCHLRWVVLREEERLLDALAKLHVEKADHIGAGSRLLGTFRANGRLVPVWDLAEGTEADEVEDRLADFARRLDDALSDETPLSAEVRHARAGLANRQVTLR